MKKSGIGLAVVGGLIGVGIILSFYGNYILFEELVQDNGEVGVGQNLVIEVELDSSETQTGIYAIQILDFKGGMVTANIEKLSKVVEDGENFGAAIEGLEKMDSFLN